MAYATWSVIFGEQPSASKWNILGSNDASFHDGTGIDALAIKTAHLENGAATPSKVKVRINGALYQNPQWKVGEKIVSIPSGESDDLIDTGVAKFPADILLRGAHLVTIYTTWDCLLRKVLVQQGGANLELNIHTWSQSAQDIQIAWWALGY